MAVAARPNEQIPNTFEDKELRMPEKTDSEVYMLLLVHEDNGNGNATMVRLAGTAYDLKKGLPSSGRVVDEDEVGDGLQSFVMKCYEDMDSLCRTVVIENAKQMREHSERSVADLYVKLLTEFADKPIELIGNMLAALLTACTVNLLEEPGALDEITRRSTEN